MRQPQDHHIQRLDFRQLLFGIELPFCKFEPGLCLVGLDPGFGVGRVDHAGAAFDVAVYAATSALAAEGHGEGIGAGFVDFVFLGIAGFAAAVKDVVELEIIGAGEDS